ncbi:hypothetical protein B0H34DRAFT_671175 [Crassisporium funariophilum]|nr:hypothetical protein B0H34DRAFT_671175 [Crassisporium funariophilum]
MSSTPPRLSSQLPGTSSTSGFSPNNSYNFGRMPISDSRPNNTLNQDNSPTSTLSETGTTSAVRLDYSRSTLVNLNGTPRSKQIRSDPSMLTCFDPADRELYDLWAPKR